MRSKSGKDEGRNNLRDPDMRDRERDRERGESETIERKPKAPADHRTNPKD